VKVRGIRGGVLLRFEMGDDVSSVESALQEVRHLLDGNVSIEVGERLDASLIEPVQRAVVAAGGTLKDLRPTAVPEPQRGETVIVGRTVRSGARVESAASVVVLGDVNAGAEILAADDIIVLGTLRGLAHAGAAGNDRAIVWAQRILSHQLRIGSAVAQGAGSEEDASGPEVAQLKDGQIVIRPWTH